MSRPSSSSSSRKPAASKTSGGRSGSSRGGAAPKRKKSQHHHGGKRRAAGNEKDDDDDHDEDDDDEDEDDDDEERDTSNKVGQPPFTVFEIAAFLRNLFQLPAGRLYTVVDKFKRRKVGKKTLLAFCGFCNNRASLNMRVDHSLYSDAERADYASALAIYDDLCERAERSSWIAKALDPHYVLVDWNGPPAATYTAAGGTLRTLMQLADGGNASLPRVGGARPIRLTAANNYNVLHCNDAVCAKMVIKHVNQSHPKQAICFYAVTRSALRNF